MPADITPIIRPSGAARIVTDSCNAAWDRGLFVSTARDLGVICTSHASPRWEIDPRGGRAISALGAVLLIRQPPIADIDTALSRVFDTRPEFHEGVEDACAGERDISRDDRLYVDGALIGAQLRELIQRRQGVPRELPGHRFSPEASMSAGSENPAGKMRGPVDSDAARELSGAVLVERLGELTVSEGLDALADSFAARMGDMGAEQAGELRIFEQTLRQLAEEARGSGV